MSYSKLFSTENADYHLVYGIHLRSNIEDVFEADRIGDLDAIVLENAVHPTLENLGMGVLMKGSPYEDILKNVVAEKLNHDKAIPVYFGDCDTGFIRSMIVEEGVALAELMAGYSITSKIAERFKIDESIAFILNTLLFFGLKTLPLAYSIQRGETDSPLTRVVADTEYFPPTTLEFRNALIAAKIEDYLAPRLHKELGKKPKIAIIYGAGHAGIREDILSKRRRDFVLWLYKKINYIGMKHPSLENLVEFALNEDNEWVGKMHKTGLF